MNFCEVITIISKIKYFQGSDFFVKSIFHDQKLQKNQNYMKYFQSFTKKSKSYTYFMKNPNIKALNRSQL